MNKKPYRPCVVGVFINKEQKVLVAQRSDYAAWQFPQGGVDEGESFADSLFREMKEEIGSDQFTILKSTETLLRYEFPPDLVAKLAKKYRGQEQKWFLCAFKKGHGPDLASASSHEFVKTKWVTPEEAVQAVVGWKKDVYRKALKALMDVNA